MAEDNGGKPYLRRKGHKWVIERKVREDNKQRTIYMGTLPAVEEVLEWLASRKNGKQASQNHTDNNNLNGKKVGYYLLNEQANGPKKRTLTQAEINYLHEISK